MMKNVLEWIKSYVLWARIDPDEFAKIKTALIRSNRSHLHSFSRIAVVLFAVAAILTRILSIDDKIDQLYGYCFGLILSLGIFICNRYFALGRPKLQLWLIYLFDCVLIGFGFLLAFVCSPDQLTISLLVMFALVPMFFTDRPFRMICLYAVLEILFVFLVIRIKPEASRNLEIINMIVYSNTGLVLGLYMTRMKLERFIFENRVKELSSREQSNRYLKSIADIYVAMYQGDLETGMCIELHREESFFNKVDFNKGNFRSMLKAGVLNIVDRDFRKIMERFVDLDSLRVRLKGKNTITREFLSNKGTWCRARFVNVMQGEEIRYVIFAVEDINEQKLRERELISQAETDAMTGLFNRNGGVPKIKELMHEGRQGMLCLFDVDKFKSINDTMGHQVGDKVIIAVADAMRKTFRDGDVLLRLGGDEYMVFLNKITSEEQGAIAISRFFSELGKIEIEGFENCNISVSLGATFFKGGSVDFDALYKQADECTYESKKIKGRSFTFWRE